MRTAASAAVTQVAPAPLPRSASARLESATAKSIVTSFGHTSSAQPRKVGSTRSIARRMLDAGRPPSTVSSAIRGAPAWAITWCGSAGTCSG